MVKDLKKTFKIVVTIYLCALLLSWIIQYLFPTSDKSNLYLQQENVEVTGDLINHDYYNFKSSESAKTIVVLPDLFGGPEFLFPLALSLQDSVNTIMAQYPTSTLDGNDIRFSVNKRAQYVETLIDSLQLKNVHLMGHGYGGLIGIHLSASATGDQFKSLTLISSYGPQELQFLGNYMINRTLYSMLYPVITIFKYLIPHMGWYYEQPVDYNFANSLTALDQREVREKLKQIDIPVHIIQPINDRYVSLSIAEELHRLLAHSSILAVRGNHNTTKENPAVFAPDIVEFVSMAEQNRAYTSEDATPGRVEASLEPFDASDYETIGGWTLVIIMVLIFIIAIFSEDLACIAGGLLVASGIIDFWFAVLASCIGVLIPDVIIYSLGRWIGNPILQFIPFRWFIKQEDIVKAEQMYRMRGVEIIFATRFLPGTRLPVYLVSGMIHVKFGFFLFYFVLAMMIWAPLLVWVSALVGQPMISYLATYQEEALWLVPVMLGLIYLVVKGITLISTPTGRRKVIVIFGRLREKYLGS